MMRASIYDDCLYLGNSSALEMDDLPLRKIVRLGEENTHPIVWQVRWPQTDGEPVHRA